jgi:hypothetical protein
LSRQWKGAASLLIAAWFIPNVQAQAAASTVLPGVEIYSEFQRIDPYGNVVGADKGDRPREIISPAVPRNAHVAFHVAVTVPPGENFFLFVVPNPLDACGVEMYRERFAQTADGWVPDALIELHSLPDFGFMPDPDQNIPGQNTRVYLLDLWIPPTARPPGFRIELQMKMGYFYVRPMEIRVIPVNVPDPPKAGEGAKETLPGIEVGADAAAIGVLKEYISGHISYRGGKPATVRDILRRDAIQDVMLARSLGGKKVDPKAIKRFWKSLPVVEGAEGYLRIRDYIDRQAALSLLN